MNERMIENLLKSKLKGFLAGKKSFGSKSVNSGDEGEREQPAVNTVTTNKQRRRKNKSGRKLKSESNGWNLTIYKEQKSRQTERHAA